MLLCYLLRVHLKREEKNVNDNIFAYVAEVNSKDEAKLQPVGQP